MESSSSDEEEAPTFVQVLSDKYNPDNFPYSRGQGLGIVLLPTPPGSPVKDRLFLPSVLVLNDCGVSKAGEGSDIAAFCSHVVELDLSQNQLRDWAEVSTIVSNIPNLDFVNLSMNPLQGALLDPGLAQSFSRVRRLVLINTHIDWSTVHTLTRETPQLEELFLCLNHLTRVEYPGSRPCPSLRLLHITENHLRQWSEVQKLGLMFPRLTALVLAHNPLQSLYDGQGALERLFFPELKSINLNHSGLDKWEDVERLNSFPKLVDVKATGIPLLQPYSPEERRSLLLAQLPSVLQLNGSAVSDGEREDAERFFIRYYQERPEQEPPHRYGVLVQKYGELAPLVDVDLRPRCTTVQVLWGEQVETLGLGLEQTVGDLKKQLRALLRLPNQGLRLFYISPDTCSILGPEEMRCGARALHSYSIRDGDQILVVLRAKGRTSSSDS